jgi:hypothetical protein
MYLCDATWLRFVFVTPKEDNSASVESLCDRSLLCVPRRTC